MKIRNVVGGQISGQPTGMVIVSVPDKQSPKGFRLAFRPVDDIPRKKLVHRLPIYGCRPLPLA